MQDNTVFNHTYWNNCSLHYKTSSYIYIRTFQMCFFQLVLLEKWKPFITTSRRLVRPKCRGFVRHSWYTLFLLRFNKSHSMVCPVSFRIYLTTEYVTDSYRRITQFWYTARNVHKYLLTSNYMLHISR